MIIDMSDPNPAIKIFLEKESDTAAYIMLRPASSSVLKKIRDKTHIKKFKNVRGTIHEYFEIDEDLYDLELWEYCLPGWGNIKDSNGNQIKYSKEKAIWLLQNSPYFSSRVSEELDTVKDMIDKRAKGAKKN